MKKSLLAIALIAGIVSMMSCNKNDKENSLEGLCYASVSEDVLKVADVTLHYYDVKGQEATERMTTTEWRKTWTTTTLPAKVAVWIQITPKNAEGSGNYKLKAVAGVGYLFTNAEGKKWADGWVSTDPYADPDNVTSADVQAWCSKGSAVGCEVDAKGMGKQIEADFGGNFWFFGNSFCKWIMVITGHGEDYCEE